nr:hematopoietic cell signal transducer-like [Anolis sagrei ordinatus]
MWSFAASIFCLLIAKAATKGTGHYDDCYHITTEIMVGIVAGDVLLTALLLIPVYYCARTKDTKQSDPSEPRDYINMMGKYK